MEFDEMKKIWNEQSNEAFYGINEKALHDRILSKKKTAFHITNISELLWIIGNSVAGCFILGISVLKPEVNIFMYLLAIWMLGSGLYVLVCRIYRIRTSHHFDRSMRGDLLHAIAMATYQVRFSQLGRWSILPVGIFVLLGVWEGGKPLWLIIGILIFFMLINFATAWEHNIYKAKKNELEVLQSKLENE